MEIEFFSCNQSTIIRETKHEGKVFTNYNKQEPCSFAGRPITLGKELKVKDADYQE